MGLGFRRNWCLRGRGGQEYKHNVKSKDNDNHVVILTVQVAEARRTMTIE